MDEIFTPSIPNKSITASGNRGQRDKQCVHPSVRAVAFIRQYARVCQVQSGFQFVLN